MSLLICLCRLETHLAPHACVRAEAPISPGPNEIMSAASLLEQVLRLVKPRKALHIGASHGQEARLYHRFGIETWHVEAIPEVFQFLESNLASLDDQHPVQACLADQPGLERVFYVANNGGMSSSLLPLGRHEHEYPTVVYERQITVRTETVDSLIDQGVIDADIDFLLIDAQGAELIILHGAYGLLGSDSVKAVLVETGVVPLYEGGATYLDISQCLLKYNLHLRHAAFGDNGWTDALFMMPYWQSAKPLPANRQQSGDNTAGSGSTKNNQSEPSSEVVVDYAFLLRNESAIADAIDFCPWDKPAFDEDIINAVNLLVPTACAHPLIRIGGEGDGAYLVPDDLGSIDACFSPGISNLINFEQELADRYSITSYMCDASVNASQLEVNRTFHHFVPMWIGGYDGENTQTLDSWVAQSDHSESTNLLLQMDIEGAEYVSLLAASDSVLARFRVIVIEFHWLGKLQSSRFLNTRFMPTLQKLARYFDCVHAHANNCCGTTLIAGIDVPNVIEITYLRKDCNAPIHKPILPHPLDILNVLSKPAVLLGNPWTKQY